jgi:hypothetical protein
MTLKYNRVGFIPGIPAKDLSDEEVEKYGGAHFLIGTGLYYFETPKGVEVKQYFGGAIINILEKDEREQQAPAAPKEEKPKRKKANSKKLAKEG